MRGDRGNNEAVRVGPIYNTRLKAELRRGGRWVGGVLGGVHLEAQGGKNFPQEEGTDHVQFCCEGEGGAV